MTRREREKWDRTVRIGARVIQFAALRAPAFTFVNEAKLLLGLYEKQAKADKAAAVKMAKRRKKR